MDAFKQIPFELAVSSRGIEGIGGNDLEHSFPSGLIALWALIQWYLYSGYLLTLVVWAVLMGCFLGLKAHRLQLKNGGAPLPLRSFLASWSAVVGRWFLTLSPALFLLYLLIAPSVVTQVERFHDEQLAIARRPEAHWLRVEQAVEEVRTDRVLIEQLRQYAKREIASGLAAP